MPLLLVLAIVAVCYPFPWQPVLPFGPWGQAGVMLGLVFFNTILASFLSWRVTSALDLPVRDARYRAVRRFHFARKFVGYWNFISTIALVFLGWGWTVWQHLLVTGPRGPILFPFAELLLPAPYFLTLFVNWAIYWYAETRIELARGNTIRWPLPSYWLFQFRKFVLIVMLPALLMTGFQGFSRVLPEVVNGSGFQVLGIFGMIALMLVLPRIIKVALGWESMPNGPLRSHLEATASRLGVRYSDVLLWPTAGSMVNAMVSGLVRWARYIVFTDKILDHLTPQELDAIVGHELGHVKYYHIPYYTVFFVLSAFGNAVVAAVLPQWLGLSFEGITPEIIPWLALPMFMLLALYYFIFFGLLSRRCERQADIFGCRAGSCSNPDCQGHDEQTELVPGGKAICRTGVYQMISALDKVGTLNGYNLSSSMTAWQRIVQWFQAWQHGPISSRIQFLEQLAENPQLADRHDFKVFCFRVLLFLALVASIGLMASLIGWSEFVKML
jgi:STE24 endopeptidase